MSTSTQNYSARRVLVVAESDLPLRDGPREHGLAEAVRDSHVLVVAPAGPVPGERWIIDVAARERQAQQRLEAWAGALAAHALAVDVEIGDPNPRLALADARRAFRPDAVATVPRAETASCSLRCAPARPPQRSKRLATGGALPAAA